MRRDYRDGGYDQDTREEIRWTTLSQQAKAILAGDEPNLERLRASGWTLYDALAEAATIAAGRRRAAEQAAAVAADEAANPLCPSCRGSGRVNGRRAYGPQYDGDEAYLSDPCPVCGGRGRLSRDEAAAAEVA